MQLDVDSVPSYLNGTNYDIAQYKLVTDNINKHVTPRFHSNDRPTVCHNYVHSYAVRDRSNSFHLSRIDRDHPNLTPEAIAKAILPSDEDDSIINSIFSTLISRVLASFFQSWFSRCCNLAYTTSILQ